MSRSVGEQRKDALQTTIYEGPTISGPPIKWGTIEEAMRKAIAVTPEQLNGPAKTGEQVRNEHGQSQGK